jgi:hypothetical protein
MATPKTFGQSVRDTKFIPGGYPKKGVRLEDQETPAGKELIGMRSGVPVYADIEDVYGAPKKVQPTVLGVTQTPEQQRAEYQASEAPKAAAAMATPATAAPRKFFPRGSASQPEPGRTTVSGAKSQEQTFAEERASAEARKSGKLGDYFEARNRPEMAKAFPNTEDINPEWFKNYGASGKEERVLSTRPAVEKPLFERLLARTKNKRPLYSKI